MIHLEEQREDVIPSFRLLDIQDNLVQTEGEWSFLKDQRNQELFANRDRFLIDRILNNAWLQSEFWASHRHKDDTIQWKSKSAQSYMEKVDQFLLRLALLIQLTWGQPARVTELLNLQHQNTIFGHQRSILIEGGMVGTVTTYHKGYSVSGNTKIIHRYLPSEVDELLIYYLWMILPFSQHLKQLALRDFRRPSAFLWPKGEGAWESRRFSYFLREETAKHLQTTVNIT